MAASPPARETLPLRHAIAGLALPELRPARKSGAHSGGYMQLTRWNPFVELDDIQQRLNRLLVDRPAKTPAAGFADFMPAVDIQETDTDFLVNADLPDVKKDDIKIHMEDGVLAIEGERRKEAEEKGKRFHKVEREYGRFVRRFELPIEVYAAKVHAEFKDGVLHVTLPKAAAARPKLIDIKIA